MTDEGRGGPGEEKRGPTAEREGRGRARGGGRQSETPTSPTRAVTETPRHQERRDSPHAQEGKRGAGGGSQSLVEAGATDRDAATAVAALDLGLGDTAIEESAPSGFGRDEGRSKALLDAPRGWEGPDPDKREKVTARAQTQRQERDRGPKPSGPTSRWPVHAAEAAPHGWRRAD